MQSFSPLTNAFPYDSSIFTALTMCCVTVFLLFVWLIAGGPSENKLFTGDEIWTVNGQDARNLPKQEVVDRIR